MAEDISRPGYGDDDVDGEPQQPDKWLEKLRNALRSSRKRLLTFREKRIESLKQFVGSNYSDDGATKAVPVNLMELLVNVYRRWLVARNPHVLVTTPYPNLRAVSNDFEIAMNHLLKEIKIAETLQEVALDGLFGMGIIKTGLDISGQMEIQQGEFADIGQPFALRVDLDDWVHDITARHIGEAQFMGHKYRLPLRYVQESGLFEGAERLRATHKDTYSTEEFNGERSEDISQGRGQWDDDEYVEYVEMWELYLPYENRVITIPVDGPKDLILRDVEWQGPEGGPFHLLRFAVVPNQILPLPIVGLLLDLQLTINQLWRKLLEQAKRQKTLGVYSAGADDDGTRWKNASDGDVVGYKGAQPPGEVKVGGIDNSNLAFSLTAMDKFTYLAGNLDVLGGLSAGSETLGQDQILQQNSSQRLQEMQEVMQSFTARVVQHLGWYVWTDPLIEIPMVKRVEGTDIDIFDTFTPESREGDWLQYNMDIQPYSMQPNTPQVRLGTMRQFMQEILMPGMPMFQQQGIQVNWEAMTKSYARYANMPELNEWLTFAGPMQEQESQPIQPRQAPHTVRENVRRNVSADTRKGRDAQIVGQLLGADNGGGTGSLPR